MGPHEEHQLLNKEELSKSVGTHRKHEVTLINKI